jgi:hypothetical protein
MSQSKYLLNQREKSLEAQNNFTKHEIYAINEILLTGETRIQHSELNTEFITYTKNLRLRPALREKRKLYIERSILLENIIKSRIHYRRFYKPESHKGQRLYQLVKKLEGDLQNNRIRIKAFLTYQRYNCGHLDLNISCILCRDFKLVRINYLGKEKRFLIKEIQRKIQPSDSILRKGATFAALINIKQEITRKRIAIIEKIIKNRRKIYKYANPESSGCLQTRRRVLRYETLYERNTKELKNFIQDRHCKCHYNQNNRACILCLMY